MSYLDANKQSNIVDINSTHQLGFYQSCQLECTKWWIASVARAYNSYSRTFQFSSILQEVWVTARFDVLFKSLSVKKTTNIFLAHLDFLKKLQIFLMLLGIIHAAHPYQNLHWYPLISNKNIWPKISVAYFTKWFQSIFSAGGWRMCPFNLFLLLPAYIPTQSCKRVSFWSLNPARAQNHKPEPGSSSTFIFEAQFKLESQIYRGS